MTVPAPSSHHTCPWPACRRAVPAHHLMCPADWWRLPADIRTRIWAAYRPGQTALSASPAYREALRDALAFARQAASSAGQS
jgi:hypothetical protein